MFTGIVEELGEVLDIEEYGEAARVRVRGPAVTADAADGDSIAVNGVCLTVTTLQDGGFTADVMKETLSRSCLGALGHRSRVNLERPLTLSSRLGGHLLQGHVDGTGEIVQRVPGDRSELVRVRLPGGLQRYVVEKGSLAVDGVSLTVADVGDSEVTISLIPETLERTTLGYKQPGEPVNIEVDVVAKYVEKLVEGYT